MRRHILYQNVRGLRTKTSKLLCLLESSTCDLFAITETGCNESIQDAEIILPGYSVVRCDRADGRKQGGVLLAAAPRLALRRLPLQDSDLCNAVPNCNGRQLDLVLSARGGVSVTAADEGLQPVDAYHPPLAVTVPVAVAATAAAASDRDNSSFYQSVFLSAIAMADDTNLEQLLHSASNHFTGNFFPEVVKANPGKSVVLSAYSVMTPLAFLSLASVGQSHEELLNAIGLPNDNDTQSVFSFAERKMRTIKGVELKAANKIYIPLNYELNSEFATVSRDAFNSEVKNVDFMKNVETAKEINEWVEDQTNNRIKDLVDPNSIDANTRAILVNALYFKGTWVSPFMNSKTQEKDFHVTNEKTVKVSMMYNTDDFKFVESEKLQSKILEIPYDGETTSLMVVLPNEIDGISSLLDNLKDLSVLDEEAKKMYEVEVKVSIPKFKIETTTDLKAILQKLDVKRLFNAGEAKLDRLLKTAENLYVSSATQKAFIEVNEEGTEAGAANQFGFTLYSAHYPEYVFNADHPFLFLLKERNNILFSGVYYA